MKKDANTQVEDREKATDFSTLESAAEIVGALMTDGLSDRDRKLLQDKLCGVQATDELVDVLVNTFIEELQSEKYLQEGRVPTEEERRRFLMVERKIEEKESLKEQQNRKNRMSPQWRKYALRAAAVVVPFFVVLGMYLGNRWFGQEQVFAEAVCETCQYVQKDIYLPDGTHVWLNENSKLTFPEQFGKERRVMLEGEAYFEVEHDRKRPFIVQTDKLNVRVLGTEFDVKAYPDDTSTEVFLDRGRVKVKAGRDNEVLDPSQKLTYDHLTGEMITGWFSGRIDWRSDIINASNRTLPELLRMVANYYDRSVMFDEEELNRTSVFTTKFGKEHTAEQVIAALARLTGEFEYIVENEIIYINKYMNNRQQQAASPR